MSELYYRGYTIFVSSPVFNGPTLRCQNCVIGVTRYLYHLLCFQRSNIKMSELCYRGYTIFVSSPVFNGPTLRCQNCVIGVTRYFMISFVFNGPTLRCQNCVIGVTRYLYHLLCFQRSNIKMSELYYRVYTIFVSSPLFSTVQH